MREKLFLGRRIPKAGYAPLLRPRMESVLPACVEKNTRIVTNMGAANPVGAAAVALEIAKEADLNGLQVAVILGDQVEDVIRANPHLPLLEGGEPVESLLPRMVSANAYLGADVVREALSTGAQIVVGRADCRSVTVFGMSASRPFLEL